MQPQPTPLYPSSQPGGSSGYVRFSATATGLAPPAGQPYGYSPQRSNAFGSQLGGVDPTTASRATSMRPSSEHYSAYSSGNAGGFERQITAGGAAPYSRQAGNTLGNPGLSYPGGLAASSFAPVAPPQTAASANSSHHAKPPQPASMGREFGRQITRTGSAIVPVAPVAREGTDEMALILAVNEANLPKVKDILASRRPGFAIDARDPKSKRSALMIAARNNKLEIASSLIKHGADLFAIVEQGGNAGMNALFLAVLAGHLPMVALLLKSAGERAPQLVNTQHAVSKQTALMYAIIKGHGTVVRLLVVEFKADKDLVDRLGKTAYDYAGKYGGRRDGVTIFRILEPRKEVCDTSTPDGLEVVNSWAKLGPYCPVTELCDVSRNKVHAAMLFAYAFTEASRKDQKYRGVLEAKAAESIQRAKEYLRAHVLRHGEDSVVALIEERVSERWSPLLLAQELHATDFMACDEVQDAVVKLWHGRTGHGSRFWSSVFVAPFARPFRFAGDPECFWGTPLGEFALETLFYVLFLAAYTAYMNLETTTHGAAATILWWYMYINILGTAGRIAHSVRSLGWRSFAADFFNKLDLISVLVFAVALLFKTSAAFLPARRETLLRIQYEILAYAAVVMWGRLLRVCLLSSTLGPLITMIRRMLVDLASFGLLLLVIVLGFGQTVYSVTRTEVLLFGRGEEAGHLDHFGLFFTLSGLMRSLLGDVHFDLLGSDTPTVSVVLVGLYLVVGSVLLLNLLIAILSNTYARIQNASESEFKFGYSLTVLAYSQDVGVFPAPLNIVQMCLFWADPWGLGAPGPRSVAANDGRRYRVTAAVTGSIFLALLAPFTALYLVGLALTCQFSALADVRRVLSHSDLDLLGSHDAGDDDDDEIEREGQREGLVANAAPIAGAAGKKKKDDDDGEEDLVGEEDEDSVFRSLARGVRDVDDKTMRRLVVETWERVTGQGANVTSNARLRNLRQRRQQQQAVPPPPPPPAPGPGYGGVAGQQQVINIDLRNLETKMETILQGLRMCQSFRKHFMGTEGGVLHA